jgi:hypothetical protein
MPTTVINLTKEDFDRYNWQDVIQSCLHKRCLDYHPLFSKKAAEVRDAGDSIAQAVFDLLEIITYPKLHLNGGEKPFWSAEVFDEVSDQQLDVLAEIAPGISDPEMRSRIADLLWMRRHSYPMVKLAIEAYIEIARQSEDPENWLEWVQRIERAFRLASSIDRKQRGIFAEVIGYVEDIIERFRNDNGLLLEKLMGLLQEHGLGNVKKYISLTQEVISRVEEAHMWYKARPYWDLLAKWYTMERNEEAALAAKLASAETFVKEAEDALHRPSPSYMVASAHLEDAIHAFRNTGGTSLRVDQLHKQLLTFQQESLKEYKRIEVPLNATVTSATEEWAKSQVKQRKLALAVFKLAFITSSYGIKELRSQVENLAEAAPLQFLITAQLVTAAGKTKERSTSPFPSDSEGREAALREKMFDYARMHQGLTAQIIVEPVREQIISEHHIQHDDLLPFLERNPFVPSGREAIYARGLAAGFAGDFLIATHLLVPQVENSLRYLLAQQGQLVSNLTSPGGIQDEFSLNKLFEEHQTELTDILGASLVFDLEGLLVQRFGSNLRNEVSHGLLNADRFGPGIASYLWWLTLKLCIAFGLLNGDDDEEEADTNTGEQTSSN